MAHRTLWRSSAENQIYQLKFVPYAIAPLLGVKNGRNAGMMLSTVLIAVADAGSLPTVNHHQRSQIKTNENQKLIILCQLTKYSLN